MWPEVEKGTAQHKFFIDYDAKRIRSISITGFEKKIQNWPSLKKISTLIYFNKKCHRKLCHSRRHKMHDSRMALWMRSDVEIVENVNFVSKPPNSTKMIMHRKMAKVAYLEAHTQWSCPERKFRKRVKMAKTKQKPINSKMGLINY